MKIVVNLEHLSEEEIETIFQNTNQAKADRAENQDHIVVIRKDTPFWRTFKCSKAVKDEIISFCKDKEIVQTIIDVDWESLNKSMQDAISIGVIRIDSPKGSYAPIILKIKMRKEISYGVFKDNAPEGFRNAVIANLIEPEERFKILNSMLEPKDRIKVLIEPEGRMKVLDKKLKGGTITKQEIAELAKLISKKLGGIK